MHSRAQDCGTTAVFAAEVLMGDKTPQYLMDYQHRFADVLFARAGPEVQVGFAKNKIIFRKFIQDFRASGPG